MCEFIKLYLTQYTWSYYSEVYSQCRQPSANEFKMVDVAHLYDWMWRIDKTEHISFLLNILGFYNLHYTFLLTNVQFLTLAIYIYWIPPVRFNDFHSTVNLLIFKIISLNFIVEKICPKICYIYWFLILCIRCTTNQYKMGIVECWLKSILYIYFPSTNFPIRISVHIKTLQICIYPYSKTKLIPYKITFNHKPQ